MLCLWLPLAPVPTLASGCGDSGAERYEPRTFLGYACEDDCRRHKAGFLWAERHAVTDSRECDVLPSAEAEGCAAFMEDGRDAFYAGDVWAVENEIVNQVDCLGAGERFFVGCVRQLQKPINTYLSTGNCELRKSWTRSRLRPLSPVEETTCGRRGRPGEGTWQAVVGDP
jgi:hypothetical protein